MSLRKACVVSVVALIAAACGGEGGLHWAGSETDSAGVIIVANPAEGMWSASDNWALEEEIKIGALEGDLDYQFGQVGWVVADSRGRMFAVDVQAQHVKVFSPEGQYEQTLGGQGGGPGEMQGAMFMVMGPGDTLLVPDMQNMRVNRYAPDGSSLGSFPIAIQEQGLPMMFRATTDGVIAEQVRPLTLPGQPALENPEDAIVLLAADGTITDTLMVFPSGGTFNLGGASPEINIYSPEPAWDVTDDLKLLFGVNDEYRIGFYGVGGTLERVLTKPFERKPVAERDREAIMAFFERAWSDAGVPAQMMPQLRQMVHFGETFPAFAQVLSGPDQTVWVQHVQPASELSDEEFENFDPMQDTGAPDWDVFDAAGRYLGVVTMPRRFSPRTIRGDRIYGVWRDDLDVQYVVRLRVVGILEYREL